MDLRNANALTGYKVQASDGLLGKLDDFFFDDEEWKIRYLLVDTHPWLPGGKTIISREVLQTPDWHNGLFPVALNTTEVKAAPPVDLNATVSREVETALHKYFSWLPYWGPGEARLGTAPITSDKTVTESLPPVAREMRERQRQDECHVHRLGAMKGFRVMANGDELGVVEDHVLEDDEWRIRYFVVDTHRWLPGRRVLVVPAWIDRVVWKEKTIHIVVDKEVIEASPEYHSSAPIQGGYEDSLLAYYREMLGEG